MPRSLTTNFVFLREFVRRFHTTGSVLPSSRFLSRGLARFVRENDGAGPRRILEVGPGTGPVTKQIVQALGPEDRLDLVEINEHFVELLQKRFASEPVFQAVADRTQIHCRPIEELMPDAPYDVIISGLPLNNFSVELVEQILQAFTELGRPGGRLSFFEYAAIRGVKAVASGRKDRERLRGIGQALDRFLQQETRRETVWLNFPPAWIHHVQFAG